MSEEKKVLSIEICFLMKEEHCLGFDVRLLMMLVLMLIVMVMVMVVTISESSSSSCLADKAAGFFLGGILQLGISSFFSNMIS